MKTFPQLLVTLLLMMWFVPLQAQIDSVIVEKYYISDDLDASDTLGGNLPVNSATYRVYVDLAANSRLMGIYGNMAHPLVFSSTEHFFNNRLLGKTFGYQVNKNNLDNNTTALDTWLTLGFASNKQLGILKNSDTDGSIVGGVNNDGGSSLIAGGLLRNNTPAAGLPLTVADGLIPTDSSATGFFHSGFLGFGGEDSTIFGSIVQQTTFISFNSQLTSNKGIIGATSDNRVLIAQLTTHGAIAFLLNVNVLTAEGKTIQYVAGSPTGEEIRNSYLVYPRTPECGCTDPDYLEYQNNLDCHVQDSCKRLIVYGCMDPIACNYDPTANFNIAELCCYPGRCNDRPLEVVCPSFRGNNIEFTLFPNPASNQVVVEIGHGFKKDTKFVVYNCYGIQVKAGNLGETQEGDKKYINIDDLPEGLYYVRLFDEEHSTSHSLIKQ